MASHSGQKVVEIWKKTCREFEKNMLRIGKKHVEKKICRKLEKHVENSKKHVENWKKVSENLRGVREVSENLTWPKSQWRVHCKISSHLRTNSQHVFFQFSTCFFQFSICFFPFSILNMFFPILKRSILFQPPFVHCGLPYYSYASLKQC